MAHQDTDADRMELRDRLALDRTVLANERTLLAYIRTALALLAGGGTLLRFFRGNRLIEAAGALLLAFGALAVVGGIVRFRSVTRRLNNTRA